MAKLSFPGPDIPAGTRSNRSHSRSSTSQLSCTAFTTRDHSHLHQELTCGLTCQDKPMSPASVQSMQPMEKTPLLVSCLEYLMSSNPPLIESFLEPQQQSPLETYSHLQQGKHSKEIMVSLPKNLNKRRKTGSRPADTDLHALDRRENIWHSRYMPSH